MGDSQASATLQEQGESVLLRLPFLLSWQSDKEEALFRDDLGGAGCDPASQRPNAAAASFVLHAPPRRIVVLPLGARDSAFERACEGLRDAVSLADACVPLAHAFIFRHLKLIWVRDGGTDRVSSSSWCTKPSVTCFEGGAEAGPLRLAETLVHEAVHSCLYEIERRDPAFRAQVRGHDDATVVSPWTGRVLPYHSFVHAIFVWYGVLSFLALVDRARPAAETRRRMDEVRRGFAARTLTSDLLDSDGQLWRCVSAMELLARLA